MKLPVFEKTKMLTPTPGERLTGHPAVALLLFFPVMLVAELGRFLIYTVIASLLPDGTAYAVYLLVQLFATLATVAAVLLYCLLAEKRTMMSLGFVRRGAVSEYAIGLLGGFVLFGGAVWLCVLTNTVTVTVNASSQAVSWELFALYLLGFLIQGMSEEMLCRSYLMVSLSRGWPLWACVLTNALLFSLLHIGNPGISVIALINIFLFGLFASMLTLRRGSIWMVGALHSMWNFAQGNLFGMPVSGITGIPSPLTAYLHGGTWQELINGGSFGLEGGLAITVVLGVACAIALFMPTKKKELAQDMVHRS